MKRCGGGSENKKVFFYFYFLVLVLVLVFVFLFLFLFLCGILRWRMSGIMGWRGKGCEDGGEEFEKV